MFFALRAPRSSVLRYHMCNVTVIGHTSLSRSLNKATQFSGLTVTDRWYIHRKQIIVAVHRSPKPYKILSDCFFNTRKIQNARLILKWTNQSIFCTSSAPMSVSSALFCTAAIPNVTDIAMHILCGSRRTCSSTYSLPAEGFPLSFS